MADVVHVVNPDGSHSIGVDDSGVFVPFVTLSNDTVVDAVERGNELNRRAGQGDPEAVAAGGVPPATSSSSSSSAKKEAAK